MKNRKNIIYMSILSSLFSLSNCNGEPEKIYTGTPKFKEIEIKLPIKEERAIQIYDDNFSNFFLDEKKSVIDSNFWKYIYVRGIII